MSPNKHSVCFLNGTARRRTSISIPDEIWTDFLKIAAQRGEMIGELVFGIDAKRRNMSLSEAVRQFTLAQLALALSPPIAADDDFERATFVYGDGEP